MIEKCPWCGSEDLSYVDSLGRYHCNSCDQNWKYSELIVKTCADEYYECEKALDAFIDNLNIKVK